MLNRIAKAHYGWRIALALAVTETASYGVLYYAFAVFLAPMERELGWSRAELTGAFSLSFLVMAALAYPVGAWVDRHGPRALMTVGSIGASFLVIAWSQVERLSDLYLIWAGIGVCAAAVLYDPAFAAIAQWFDTRRNTALTIVTFAAGFASTIFLPLSHTLLQAWGWRGAVFGLGVILAGITIPLHALVLRRRTNRPGAPAGAGRVGPRAPHVNTPPGVGFEQALSQRLFWLLTLGFGLAALSASAIRLHFIPVLTAAGMDPGLAATATGMIGVTQVLGRLLFAPLERWFPGRQLLVGIFGVQSLATALLFIGQTTLPAVGFIALFGAAQGAATLARPAILAEVYGAANYGRISSVMSMLLTLTATAAPWAASLIYDAQQSYGLVLGLVAGLSLAATATLWLARRVPGPDRDETTGFTADPTGD